MRKIHINRSYSTQRVTGQQRYAAEITRRLARIPRFVEASPRGIWSRSTLRTWAWVQFLLPVRARGSVVLSMTSRAPLWHRRHVVVVHDLFVLTNPEWYSRRYIWTHAPLLRRQIRTAAAVVAVSQPVADQLAPLRPEPVAVAPNAPSEVFRERAVDDGDGALAERGLTPDGYFLAVGSRDPRKNLRRLAEAYGRLSDDERRRFRLVVVGGVSGIFSDEEVHWPDGTVVAGYVPDDDLRQLYRHARSVVFVALAEGFGLPLVEAGVAGARSLMISDIDVFRWICGPSARYVDPLSTDSIAAGLRREIETPQRRGMDLERFDWNSSAAVIEEVCRRVAGR